MIDQTSIENEEGASSGRRSGDLPDAFLGVFARVSSEMRVCGSVRKAQEGICVSEPFRKYTEKVS